MASPPNILHGRTHVDFKGSITFFNDFQFKGVDRFYFIHHPEKSVIRAWQGHQRESKYYIPVKGKWIIGWVKMEVDKSEDEWNAEYRVMNAADSQIIFIPAGYANGLKALENDSIILGFNLPGEKSEDIIRWEPHKWLDWESIV